MFVEKGKAKPAPKPGPIDAGAHNPFVVESRENTITLHTRLIIYSVLGTAVLACLGIIYIFLPKTKPIVYETVPVNRTQTATSSGRLPLMDGNGNENNHGSSTLTDLKAEFITFGDFYIPPQTASLALAEDYNLPLNVKSDVINYYELSRKLNLDPYLEDLNNQGFAIIDDAPFIKSAEFYDTYRELLNEEIPVVITKDFIVYYFQNEVKQVYKEVQKSVFYDNVWQIFHDLYKVALARYMDRLEKTGLVNDPVLEGQRLATAYYAMTLKLLMPEASQINGKTGLADANRFTEKDLSTYTFDMPEEIATEVDSEFQLVGRAGGKVKSPLLLYTVDYSRYAVPGDYQANMKLNNFYRAIKWLNTVFPVDYISDDCPNCLLDHDDWQINMIAGAYITKDLSDEQELKNLWAMVYKFIAFFSGLRTELTYLDYRSVYDEVFGRDFAVDRAFSKDNPNREDQTDEFRQKIKAITFAPIEGGLDRADETNRPYIGMRLLQEPFWPNDYLLDQLTGKDLKFTLIPGQKPPLTNCGGNYRCRAIGLDLLNLLEPQNQNQYFLDNSDYSGYDDRVRLLKKELSTFDRNAWNNNIYWSTLDLLKPILSYDMSEMPAFTNSAWVLDRDDNSALAAWVNLHLPADEIDIYSEDFEANNLGVYKECNLRNYIEPNRNLLNVLTAKSDMLSGMIEALGVGEKTNTAIIELRELKAKIDELYSIMEKEISGTQLNADDCKIIKDFSTRYQVKRKGERSFSVNFSSGNALRTNLNDINAVILIYKSNGENILAVGPIFNYSEH